MGNNENDWANIHSIRIPGVNTANLAQSENDQPYQVSEWARDPSIKGAVGISLDDKGNAYVARTSRRKQSSLDIRHHQNWVKKDLSFTSIEDRRQFYKEGFPGGGWRPPDRNNDGNRDWRDLTVQKDNAVLVADRDQDGKAEFFHSIGEYHSEVTGIAAGVVAVGDAVFVAAEPNIFRYVDSDNDDIPDLETLVSTGYSLHIGQGGHNMSGLTLGPDGRVYWSLGDKGHSIVTTEGRKYHMPNAGGIFRCEMDGSNVERFSSGERNAQELGFDSHGNLFSMDNDGDYPGEMERALYITEGSMHGWRLNWQWLRKQDFTRISGIDAYNPWMDEKLFLPDSETFAAYLTPTIGNFGPGPCGFTANPGTALSEELSDHFFMTNQKNEVRTFRFIPKGAHFRFEEDKPIPGGASNTGLAVGPDGALYAASWNGAIYRFDVTKATRHPLREETRQILATKSSSQSIPTLTAWLDHADQRVRMKGQFELVKRGTGGLDALTKSLTDASLIGKLHAIWGIGMAARTDAHEIRRLSEAWQSTEPEVIAQAAKVTGDLHQRSTAFTSELIAGLDHESERVQFFCAIALGNQKAKTAAPTLIRLLARNGPTDAYLRHAGTMGIAGTLSPSELSQLASHPSRDVRLSAIVALRRHAAPHVRSFLNDKDELVLLEAARAIHDDQSIPEALTNLSALLEKANYKNEALMRRVINAAFRNGTEQDLERLTNYIYDGKGSEKLRRTALASILWWSAPPVLDAVEGRYRRHAPRDAAPVAKAVRQLIPTIVREPSLLEVILNGAAERKNPEWLNEISALAQGFPARLQHRFIHALAKTSHPDLKQHVENGLSSSHAEIRQISREYADRAGISVLALLLAIVNDPAADGKPNAIKQLATLKEPAAQREFLNLIKDYKSNSLPPEFRLEVWEGAKAKGIPLPATADRLTHGGNPAKGKQKLVSTQCTQCHQIGTLAVTANPLPGSIGPDLSSIGGVRTRIHLVNSILNPNQDITEGFGTATLQLESGEELSGLLTERNEKTWNLKLPDNSVKRVPVSEISSHKLTSLMPTFEEILTDGDIRDIIAYLSELK